MRTNIRARLTVAVSVLTLLSIAQMSLAQSGPNASYSDFAALADASGVQVRLTYVGALQDEPLPPLILTVGGQEANAGKFREFQRSTIVYPPEFVKAGSKSISSTQMKDLIANVGTIPSVAGDGVSASPWLSFALCTGSGSETKVSEAVLDRSDTLSLLQQICAALEGDPEAFAAVTELGCAIGAVGAGTPTDVSDSISVKLSGVRLNRKTGLYVGKATVTNHSAVAVEGPLSLVFMFSKANVSLNNSVGLTCATTPPGLGYLNATLKNNTLGAGETIEVKLNFASPDANGVSATVKVLAGAGAR